MFKYLEKINLRNFSDERGNFIKFPDLLLPDFKHKEWKEEFIGISSKNVIRGMHFQVPPYDHDKFVCCLQGSILDVVVDLHKGQSYGRLYVNTLQASEGIFIPRGFAHGFLSLTNDSITFYRTNSSYSHDHDMGVLWSSLNFDWDCTQPIISKRDQTFLPFDKFNSPF